MFNPRFALVLLSLASVASTALHAQVRERMARPGLIRAPVIAAPPPGEEIHTLARPMAGPTNLTITGTPAAASLRWDAAPGASGYYVNRTDAAGATARLTADPIASTSFEDKSGGVKPGVAYTYHVTAAHPSGGTGTAQVTFTPPAPAVPDSVRVEQRAGQSVLLWGTVSGAGSYEITESWMQPVTVPTYSTHYSADGTPTTVTTYTTRYDQVIRTHIVPAPQVSLSLGTNAKGHRYSVGAMYPPSGVAAPRAQWKYVVVP